MIYKPLNFYKMSEKEFTKRFWLQVGTGLVILIITGALTTVFTAKATTDRSIRNERAIIELYENKSNKTEDELVHKTIDQKATKNQADIDGLRNKIDLNQVEIINKIDKVNQNLLEVYKRNK